MEHLNYHHLYYFWIIAREGSVSKASAKLRLAQSTVSTQLKALEDILGHQLFVRGKRGIELTETGRLALNYADTIFATGRELMDVVKNRAKSKQTAVRVGSINSISKYLQVEFVRPVLNKPDVRLLMVEASLPTLIRQLQNHTLDVVISNMPVPTDRLRGVYNHELGEIDVWVVAHPKFKKNKAHLPQLLSKHPMYVPTHESRVRSDFDLFCEQAGVVPNIRGEIEDVAILRILALSGAGLVVLPEIAVRSDIRDRSLVMIDRMSRVYETMWAVTTSRKMPNPHVHEMIRTFAGRYRLNR